jgi:hypothetical protein
MPSLVGQSNDPNVPGVLGENTGDGGSGVFGRDDSVHGGGVIGHSQNGRGIYGESTGSGTGVWGFSQSNIAVVGESQSNEGVRGVSHNPNHGGVVGVCDQTNGTGVFGTCDDGKGGAGKGVWGQSNGTGWGVLGESRGFEGVRGISHNPNHGGVVGICDKPNGIGVFGFCDDGTGSLAGTGVWGNSSQGEGVHGETNSLTFAAVAGITLNANATGAGVYGESRGHGPAGYFKGNVVVTGDVILQNADCAEDFDVAALEGVEPGSVMVIGDDSALRESEQAYDKRVAGVVSGGGDYKLGIVLDRREPAQNRKSIALLGKVYCKVEATRAPIEVGDLLTTSPTRGHAMKASDPFRAFGAVLGKALGALKTGTGLIPILVALQ